MTQRILKEKAYESNSVRRAAAKLCLELRIYMNLDNISRPEVLIDGAAELFERAERKFVREVLDEIINETCRPEEINK